jgi:hypothetical protein
MTSDSVISPQEPAKRPALVWLISIFYVLSVGWTIFSYFMIFSGAIPQTEQVKAYYQSLTIIDYVPSLVIGTAYLVGAILLFLLKKPAFLLFLITFGVNLVFTVYQIFATNWLSAIGGPGLCGAIFGYIINIAIIVYSKRLIDKGVLR